MSNLLEFKKKVIAEFIRAKEAKLNDLKSGQRKQLSDVITEDIDHSDPVESPREQLLDEVGAQSASIDLAVQELAFLKSLHPEEALGTVAPGALLRTNVGYFLVGSAQEPFTWDGKKFIGISTTAPLYKKMEGMKAKAEFHFGNIEYVIEEIV